MDPLSGVVGLGFVDFLSNHRRNRTEGGNQFGFVGCTSGRRRSGRDRLVALEEAENTCRSFGRLSFPEFGCHP